MNSAAAHIARLDAAIAREGQTVTLRRLATDFEGAEAVEVEVEIPAHVIDSAPQDLVSGDDVADIQVVLSATGIAEFGLPVRDDQIEIHGNPCSIQRIGTRYYGSQLVRVNLLCRG